MKPMKFKNDLEMWHKFAQFSEWFKLVAEAQEGRLYSKCEFYAWDKGASEEYCHCEQIERKKDFVAKEECWKCPYYRSVEEEMQR